MLLLFRKIWHLRKDVAKPARRPESFWAEKPTKCFEAQMIYSGAFIDSTIEMLRSLPFIKRLTQSEKKMVRIRANR